jgi:hypothetical protein
VRVKAAISYGGTKGSNPVPSSGESVANSVCGAKFGAGSTGTAEILTGPAVEKIAAPVVAPGEIDKFAADARRPGGARQFAQLAGHLSVMVAVRKRGRRFHHCQ